MTVSPTAQVAAPIQRLAQVVADAIAAGEVVERPASVVKELCENSIDAGARHIVVDVDSGGLVRIAVSDDGVGIPADQLQLAVARHATSKIRAIADLDDVASLGFRGEALASIAAVADVRITSTTAAATGAVAHVRGGELLTQGAAARAPGTTIEVCDLFFNTPARLRFLRSTRAEAAACTRLVGELALTHPEISFSYRVDGRDSLGTPGGTLREAIAAVLGSTAANELLDINANADGDASEHTDIRVSGSICQPRAHRGTRQSLVIVVNGRRVHNRALSVAVEEAYRSLLPIGRHPFGVVLIEMPGEDVDVNVHPSKREVRFREEGRVFAAVQRACWATVQDGALYTARPEWSATSQRIELNDARSTLPWLGDGPGFEARPVAAVTSDPATAASDTPADSAATQPHELTGLQLLGQAADRWLLGWLDDRVVLIDPHAAHEKIIYNQILKRWAKPKLGADDGDHVQLLLIPAVIECDPTRFEAFISNAEWLATCGFDIEEFGPNSLRCRAVPSSAANAAVEPLLGELLDALAVTANNDERSHNDERRHRVAALIACHAAVRFGDRLGEAEQRALLTNLAATEDALTCPHGRPTVMILEDAALRRAFRRPL